MKCQQCQIGHYHTTKAPFLHELNGQIMVLPDAPAFTCDICGHTGYADGFLHRMEYLIDRLVDVDSTGSYKPARPSPNEKTGWQTTRRSR